MGKHIQFLHQRHHIEVGVTTDTITIPSPIAETLPADEANVNILVSQGYVLHNVPGGDADLNWTMGALQPNGTRIINFSRNLDDEWVKVQWLGAE